MKTITIYAILAILLISCKKTSIIKRCYECHNVFYYNYKDSLGLHKTDTLYRTDSSICSDTTLREDMACYYLWGNYHYMYWVNRMTYNGVDSAKAENAFELSYCN